MIGTEGTVAIWLVLSGKAGQHFLDSLLDRC
jgi:hypothetical protein